jgi:hypothetical protein
MVIRFALNALTLLWYTSVVAALYIGWSVADHRYIVASSGIGYWLGIIGGSMMLLLLVYPLRKKNPNWKFLGSIKFWFRFHMILGILGPVLIIFHSGYRLASLNGRVAFISMLIVASSGLIGRYLYRRIHYGLYGGKIRFKDLYRNFDEESHEFELITQQTPDFSKELKQMEDELVVQHTGVNRSLGFYTSRRWKLRKLRNKVLKEYKPSDDRRNFLDRVLGLRSICKLGINEILFSYWHILHFPLFIMLVISGITHVVVVHFY